ncbi:MAG: hypothetical protein KGM87_10425 [Betaproteobacteria bacterium]|nr:hypothetical protein [Betaproteobacteria bacterium]
MKQPQAILRAVLAGALSAALAAGPWAVPVALAASATQRPQVVIALGNSESMDGDLSGAIMTGSGQLSSGLASLYNSSSPVNYVVPSGFTPPVTPTQTASAPYTVSSGGLLYDNSASRLNVAKAGILTVLNQYLPSMDFALESYSTSGLSAYTTWVYYMSPSGGFAFANALPANGFSSYAAYQSFVAANQAAGTTPSPAPTRWVNNPCYNYPNASSSVNTYCTSIAKLYGADTLSDNAYMQIAASSDDPSVNDVLYAGGLAGVGVAYGGPSPSNPFTYYSLSQYNASLNNIQSTYSSSYPSAVARTTTPTNAGYIPFSPQVMYAQRGFGYGAGQSATTGKTVVAMSSNLDSLTPGSSTFTTTLNSDTSLFQTALAAETNSTGTAEIKASAGQATTAGLIQGAGKLLGSLTASCAGQYVILVTDGLPTMDLSGNNWPPLGSAAGQGYGVKAAFYGVAGNSAYGIVDDSSNGGGAIGALDTANTNDQALIDTIAAIQALANKGIKTYVIGLGAGVDSTANPAAYYALNAMALAGGTAHEYPASNVPAFTTALSSIAASIFGDVIAAAPAVPGYVQSGSLAYLLASNNVYGSEQGYLDAFSTDANGNVSTNPVWQLQMTAAQRRSDLLTDQGSGTGVSLLANQAASAFGNPSSPTAQTIIDYTVDPSTSNGQYLAGRVSGSFLGTVSSQADKPVILSRPNNPNFIGSSTYRSFAQLNSARSPLVLFTTNDGFLYAISAGSSSAAGTLQWAWMPSVLLPQLQNYTTFESTNPMSGGFTTVDSADANGNWATYVVGTAQNGALHYDLQLSGCSSASTACTPAVTKVWFDQQSGYTSPPQAAPQAPAIWWDASNVAYAYYFTTSGSTSYLNVKRLYDGSTSSAKLSFTPSSTSYVDVAGGKLYVGDTAGKVWSFDLTTGSTASKVTGPTLVGTVPNESGAGALRYLGLAQTSSGIYLWATNDHQVTVFKFTGGAISTSTTGWTTWWWSSTAGSGYFASTALTSTTSNPGVSSTSAPYWLDSGSTITDSSAVEASTLIVPVTITPQASCGISTAQYDFFDLASGTFPQNKFYDANRNYLSANPVIGLGTAFAPALSQNGNGAAIVYGTASQNTQGKIGFQVAATSGLHVGPGVVGWQPVWMTQP